MQRSKIEIYFHMVWTTKRRACWLTPEIEKPIYRCIGHDVRKLNCHILALGGMPDHVHLVTSVPSTVCAAQLAKAVKGNSSRLANAKLGFEGSFDWQDNFAAFSVGSELEAVIEYVRRKKSITQPEIYGWIGKRLMKMFDAFRFPEVKTSGTGKLCFRSSSRTKHTNSI